MSDQNSNAENIAVLREQAEASEANRIAAEAMARENAMLKAQINVDSPLGAMFATAYRGELTTEAIQKAALEIGAWKPAEVTPTTPTTDQGQQAPPAAPGTPAPVTQTYDPVEAAARMLAAGGTTSGVAGGETPPPVPQDVMAKAYEEYTDLVMRGRASDDAAIAVFGAKLKAAAEGDQSVIFDPARDREGTRQDLKVPRRTMGL